jgi:carotenoid 1,2-hydratase
VIEIAAKDSSAFGNSLQTPGGFVWWYADLVNERGDGCVLIWSFGLPFLPGSRTKPVARSRPALHFAYYKGGREQFYLLSEHTEGDCRLNTTTGSLEMGSSRVLLVEEGETVRLVAHLDEEVFGTSERLKVHLEVIGTSFRCNGASSESAHIWSPRTVRAQGSATVQCGKLDEELDGSGYVDSNASSQPLHEQGISSWRWGRVAFPEGTLVFYDVAAEGGESETLAFVEGEQGRVSDGFQVSFRRYRRGKYGVSCPRAVEIEGGGCRYNVELRHLVDDGPFYQRFLLSGVDSRGHVGSGVGECVLPSRVDVPWQRPFVRMKTFDLGGKNSMWLPLFTGNRHGRGRRLVRRLFQAGAT